MTKLRPLASLKAAAADLVKRAGGVEAHRDTRVSRSVLHSYTDPHNALRHMPIDIALSLEQRIGDPVVSRFMLMQQGFLAVRTGGIGHNSEPYPLILARITSETGDLLSAGAMSIRDGRVTLNEARRLKAEAMQVADACAALVADCDLVIAREGEP